jgi:N-acetyl-anhydromuramyl-L-alanine amidase AmpD
MMDDGSERTARLFALLGSLALVCLALWVAKTPAGSDAIDWRAISPPLDMPIHPWRWIVIHHSGFHSGDTAGIDASHVKDRGWEGIGYHFVVGNGQPMPRGRVEATWRWKQQYHGAHAGSGAQQAPYNQDGIGICVIGDYDQDPLDPFVEQRLVELCALLITHAPGLSPGRIIGHRDVPGKATDCPGRHIDIERLRFLVTEELKRQGVTVR